MATEEEDKHAGLRVFIRFLVDNHVEIGDKDGVLSFDTEKKEGLIEFSGQKYSPIAFAALSSISATEAYDTIKIKGTTETLKQALEKKKAEQVEIIRQRLLKPQPEQQLVASNNNSTKEKGKHAFWDTQPVPKLDDKVEENGPIDPPKTVAEIRNEPLSLMTGSVDLFEWSETDIDNPDVLKEVYTLLNENYVEDDDNMFRFDYSVPFLKWALKPPGFRKDWHIGVRLKSNKKLVAFITAIPAHMNVNDTRIKLVEINFLCIHKKLRDKGLAPVLIQEITRRVNKQDIWQAVYTAGVVLPKPVAKCRYWHRNLNPKKLISVGFSALGPRMTMSRVIKLYQLPYETATKGFRQLEKKDIKQASALLSKHLSEFKFAATFNEEEFEHWFLPLDGVVDSYVVENPKSHKITDFCSFYTLPSSVLNNKQYNSLKAAYSFYNVATATPIKQLVNDALIMAQKKDFDVFNCLDIMHNKEFLEELKFGIGDGNLQYYLYNWATTDKDPKDVGLVLL